MAFTSRAITFLTLSEIRREHGLPTIDDLRWQFPRRLSEEAAAGLKAAKAAADVAALAAAEAETAAYAEAEELENKCENLNPSASRAGTKVEVEGSSVLKRPRQDLGEPTESIVEYVNIAATDTASVTVAEVEGGSVRKRPRKDLDISTSLIQRN